LRQDRCMICGREAEAGRAGGNDTVQVRCPRCGPYIITRTAAAMLSSRLADNQRAVARTSHAVRTQTSEEKWLEIDSTTVHEITSRPLPAPNTQLAHLVRFLKERAEDAHLNPIEIEDKDALAGVVGAIDEASLDHLMDWASKEGYVAVSQDGSSITLTPKAWQNEPTTAAPVIEVRSESKSMTTCKGHCPQCGPNRKADIVASHQERWDDEDAGLWAVNYYRILRCCGCEEVYVQHEHLFSEDEEYQYDHTTGEHYPVHKPTYKYWPSPAKRSKPQWIEKLEDSTLGDLLDEAYGALDSDLRVLAAVGTRTALDRAMVLKGAAAASGFGEKLAELRTAGVISEHEQQLLTTLTDAGSAAAHRGWKPKPEQLTTLIDGVEAFLHRTLILGSAVDAIKSDVPAKTRRNRKSRPNSSD
jgi:ribosomal protein S27AE